MTIFQGWSLKFRWWLGRINVKILIKMLKQHATPNSSLHDLKIYSSTQQFWIIEFWAEDITSGYRFLLRLANSTFTIDTDKYYPVLRQFRRLAQGHCWRRKLCQLTKTANFKATPMKKHFWEFITCLLVMQARFLFTTTIS